MLVPGLAAAEKRDSRVAVEKTVTARPDALRLVRTRSPATQYSNGMAISRRELRDLQAGLAVVRGDRQASEGASSNSLPVLRSLINSATYCSKTARSTSNSPSNSSMIASSEAVSPSRCQKRVPTSFRPK